MSGSLPPDSLRDEERLAAKRQTERLRRANLRFRDEGRRRNFIRLIVVCVVFAGLLALLFDGDANVQQEAFAQVAAFYPPVNIFFKQTRKRQVATLHEKVASGDVVTTGRGARANIRFPDTTLVKIGPNAVFNVLYTRYSRTQGARERGFFLRTGRLWARVRKFVTGSSDFTVETPTALAAVRGTRFSVLVARGDGTTTVSVQDGVVAVTDRGPNPQTVRVHAGQQLTVHPKGVMPLIPSPMSKAETLAWKQEKADSLGSAADILTEAGGDWRLNATDLEEQIVIKPVANLAALFHIDRWSGGPADAPKQQTKGPGQGNGKPGSDLLQIAQDQAAAAERSLQASLKQAQQQPDNVQPVLDRALHAAHAFQLALASNEELPDSIGLSDLSGLQADEKTLASIRDNIDGLVKYEKTSDGYVAVVRAKPPSGALIEVHPDTIKILGDSAP